MKPFLFFLFAIACCSCSNQEPFVNHKLQFEKTGECTSGEKTINMSSNIAGERYGFEACLNADFAGDAYTVERIGDSLVLSFKRSAGEKKAFRILLDIDAYPAYNYMVIDGKEAIVIRRQVR